MKRYEVNGSLLREREYYDTDEFSDVFAYARAMTADEGFDPENAVLGVTVGNPNLYSFNLPAALVLEAVNEGWDKEALVAEMVDLFDIDPGTVSSDIDEIVHTMATCEIIREVA